MGALTWKDWATIVALILSAIALGEKVYSWYKAAKAPGENLKTRMQMQEKRQDDLQKCMDDLLEDFRKEVDDQNTKIKEAKDRAHDAAHGLSILRKEYDADHDKVHKLEEGQTAILYGIDALLDNAINGDNIEGLKAAKKHITKHMIEG